MATCSSRRRRKSSATRRASSELRLGVLDSLLEHGRGLLAEVRASLARVRPAPAVSARVRAFSSRPAARSSKLSHRAVAEAATRSASSRCVSAPSRTVCNALSCAFSENTFVRDVQVVAEVLGDAVRGVRARARLLGVVQARQGGRSLIVGGDIGTVQGKRARECLLRAVVPRCAGMMAPKPDRRKIFPFVLYGFQFVSEGFCETETIATASCAHPRRNAGPAPERRPRRSDHAATCD